MQLRLPRLVHVSDDSFSAKLAITGIYPYAHVPKEVLSELLKRAGRLKVPIAVRGTLNGRRFVQTVVKYASVWRLHLNGRMRDAAGVGVGDRIQYRKTIRHLKKPASSAQRIASNSEIPL
jgi:hypothetical protein